MKLLIVGAGLSGCTMAQILKTRGHRITVIEKEADIGGLCVTRVNEDGIKYEPFGARTFHTSIDKVRKFITKFDNFNGYIHRKGMVINGEVFPFPITMDAIARFPEKDQILEELRERPVHINRTDFTSACIDIFGRTLYSYFIENYTHVMWGREPRDLSSEWAPQRLEIREDESSGLFKEQWQGLPVHGYSCLLERMLEGIEVRRNTDTFPFEDFDAVVSTAPLDELLQFRFGRLPYRSLRFHYAKDEPWENSRYGTINLPQDPKFIRKCNFTIMHKQEIGHNLIQYQEPVEYEGADMPMYPVNTSSSNALYQEYLSEACRIGNIIPAGRLGLFKYLDMDKAVEIGMRIAEFVEECPWMESSARYEWLSSIRYQF